MMVIRGGLVEGADVSVSKLIHVCRYLLRIDGILGILEINIVRIYLKALIAGVGRFLV